MSRALTEGQVQTLLPYLYSERAEIRREAIHHTVEHQWNDARLIQALAELAGLDEVAEVREAARRALGELEFSADEREGFTIIAG